MNLWPYPGQYAEATSFSSVLAADPAGRMKPEKGVSSRGDGAGPRPSLCAPLVSHPEQRKVGLAAVKYIGLRHQSTGRNGRLGCPGLWSAYNAAARYFNVAHVATVDTEPSDGLIAPESIACCVCAMAAPCIPRLCWRTRSARGAGSGVVPNRCGLRQPMSW